MVLKAENLALTLSGAARPLFRNISFELNEGELYAVHGTAGSGKTMLGLSLCGFLPLWAGEWNLDGEIELFGEKLVQGRYRNEIGIVFENPYTQVSGLKRTIEEELAFPLECRGMKPERMTELIGRYAADFGIQHLLKRKTGKVSGGELQRIIIACTLISHPRFIFLDRLMTEIDTDFRPELIRILAEHLREFGGAALIAEDPWLLPAKPFTGNIYLSPREELRKTSIEPSYETHAVSGQRAGSDVIRVESLSFAYGAHEKTLDKISFSLGKGELKFLCGPNGTGKTTLAKIMAGILKPSSGEIILDGEPLLKHEQWQIMSLVGFALQNPGLHLSQKTVRDELALAKRWGTASDGLAELLGLNDLLDAHPLELTQAQKKRLGIALAYGRKRKVVVLDEPSQYQDTEGFTQIVQALNSITGEGKSALIITHDPRFFAAYPDSEIIRLSPAGTC